VTTLRYSLQNKQFVILTKISSKMAFENFKNFISFHETFKTTFSTHISTYSLYTGIQDRQTTMHPYDSIGSLGRTILTIAQKCEGDALPNGCSSFSKEKSYHQYCCTTEMLR